MRTGSGDLSSAGEVKPRDKSPWRWSRWLLLIVLVLAVHIVLIFIFGGRKPVTPRAVTNAPKLALAGNSNEWLILNDPTLFALPHLAGFAGPMLRDQQIGQFHRQEWTEPPRWLQLPVGDLGAVFSEFMQTNRFAGFRFELAPPPGFTEPAVPLVPQFAESSTWHVEGNLARRSLLTRMELPSWPFADVIAPSRVQVLVNAAGNVVSAVLLPLDNSGEVRDADADQRALELARAARFAPASGLTLGTLVFDWRTAAPPATNAPAGL
jgi:hypothetical protein